MSHDLDAGVPPNPGAWITTTATNRAIGRLPSESTRAEVYLAARRLRDLDMDVAPDPELDALDAYVDVVADDQLRLVFLCCPRLWHPIAPSAVARA